MNEYQTANVAAALAGNSLTLAAQKAAAAAADGEAKFKAAAVQQDAAIDAFKVAAKADESQTRQTQEEVYAGAAGKTQRMHLLDAVTALTSKKANAVAEFNAGPQPGILGSLAWALHGRTQAIVNMDNVSLALQSAAGSYQNLLTAQNNGFAAEVAANQKAEPAALIEVKAGLDKLQLRAQVADVSARAQGAAINAAEAGVNAANSQVARIGNAEARVQRNAQFGMDSERLKLALDEQRLRSKSVAEAVQDESNTLQFLQTSLGVDRVTAQATLKLNPGAALVVSSYQRGDVMDPKFSKDPSVSPIISRLMNQDSAVGSGNMLSRYDAYVEANKAVVGFRSPLAANADLAGETQQKRQAVMPLIDGQDPRKVFVHDVQDAYTGQDGRPISSAILTVIEHAPQMQAALETSEGQVWLDAQKSGRGISMQSLLDLQASQGGAPLVAKAKLSLYKQLVEVSTTLGVPYNVVGGKVEPTIRIPRITIQSHIFSPDELSAGGNVEFAIDDEGGQMKVLADNAAVRRQFDRSQIVQAALNKIDPPTTSRRVSQ